MLQPGTTYIHTYINTYVHSYTHTIRCWRFIRDKESHDSAVAPHSQHTYIHIYIPPGAGASSETRSLTIQQSPLIANIHTYIHTHTYHQVLALPPRQGVSRFSSRPS